VSKEEQSKKVKLAIISGTYPPMKCGVGDYTAILSHHLTQSGVDVSIITSKQADATNQAIKIYNCIDKWEWASIKLITNQLAAIAPDVVLFEWPTAVYKRSLAVNYLPQAIKKRFPNMRLLATLHELRYFKPWTRLRLHWLYQAVDHLILVDPLDQPWVTKKFKNSQQLSFIPIGSNIPEAKEFDRPKNRAALGIKSDDKLITFFGFANAPKGLELLIDSLIELNHPKIKLLLLSELKHTDPYQAKLLNKINHSHLQQSTIQRFNEPSNRIAQLLKSADLAALPFLDGISLKRGTLMACLNQGLPIISTIPQMGYDHPFQHEQNSWLIPINDKQALKNSIIQLISDAQLRETLSQGAMKLASSFSWTDIARRFGQLLKIQEH